MRCWIRASNQDPNRISAQETEPWTLRGQESAIQVGHVTNRDYKFSVFVREKDTRDNIFSYLRLEDGFVLYPVLGTFGRNVEANRGFSHLVGLLLGDADSRWVTATSKSFQ
jgi:hypothetical protein